MAISEAARSDLYNGLRDVIGPERTETLMSAIVWNTVDEVATKGDLQRATAELRTEIAELRTELKTDIANLEIRVTRAITSWMVTILVAVIGAIVGVAFWV